MRRKVVQVTIWTVVILLVSAAVWAADYFLIPKVERTGIAAPVEERSAETQTQKEVKEALSDDTFPVLAETFPEDMLDQPVEAGTGSMDDPEGTTILGASDDGVNKIVVTKTVKGTEDDKLTFFTADLLLNDIRELKTCFAQDSFGENVYEKTSDMAERCRAVFAVNGDCYGWRDNGIVIRNGELFRDRPARTGLVLYGDGRMENYEETLTTGQEMADRQAWITFSFGPVLVHDNETLIKKKESYTVDIKDISPNCPRTAIGKVSDHHFIFVVVDGRQPGYSKGIHLNELADLMQSMGCQEAYNLDGGASSTMYFKGQVVNHPSSHLGERNISDCIFIN